MLYKFICIYVECFDFWFERNAMIGICYFVDSSTQRTVHKHWHPIQLTERFYDNSVFDQCVSKCAQAVFLSILLTVPVYYSHTYSVVESARSVLLSRLVAHIKRSSHLHSRMKPMFTYYYTTVQRDRGTNGSYIRRNRIWAQKNCWICLKPYFKTKGNKTENEPKPIEYACKRMTYVHDTDEVLAGKCLHKCGMWDL